MRDAVLRRTNKETYTEIDMLGWMSRTALELVGQAGLGISLDSLEDEGSGPYGEALKSFMYVPPTYFHCSILTVYFDTGRP